MARARASRCRITHLLVGSLPADHAAKAAHRLPRNGAVLIIGALPTSTKPWATTDADLPTADIQNTPLLGCEGLSQYPAYSVTPAGRLVRCRCICVLEAPRGTKADSAGQLLRARISMHCRIGTIRQVINLITAPPCRTSCQRRLALPSAAPGQCAGKRRGAGVSPGRGRGSRRFPRLPLRNL